MRVTGLTLALAALGTAGVMAVATATASSNGGPGSASLNIPLPGPNSERVSQVAVKVTAPTGKHVGPLKVVAANADQLGGPQRNTQVVTAVSPKSSNERTATFKVWVFIHQFPAVGADSRATSAADDATVHLKTVDAGDEVKIGVWVHSQTCNQLANERGWASDGSATRYFDFTTDDFERWTELDNLVVAFDTPAEEQLDNTVFTKCPGAENPADDPPPI